MASPQRLSRMGKQKQEAGDTARFETDRRSVCPVRIDVQELLLKMEGTKREFI
jgi:hypothetical protein